MKHIPLLVVLAVLALAAFAVVAVAQQGAPDMPMMPEEGTGRMTGMPMGGRMGGAALAVSDDYVYVLAGGLLLKYDTDLKLVAQAELPMSEMGRGGMGRRGTGRRGGGRGGGGGRGMGTGGGMMP